MRIVKTLLLALTAISPLAASQEDDSVQNDAKKLQGQWQVIKFINASDEPTDEIKEMTFEFKGDTLMNQAAKAKAKYTLNPSKQPKWINIDEGPDEFEGIYKLEGDELILCVGRPRSSVVRPADFKASANEYTLIVLKRIKK